MIVNVIREPGDKPADQDIVDPLCTNYAVAVERGRNELDEKGFSKKILRIKTPFRTPPLPGAIVQVQDTLMNIQSNGKLTGWKLKGEATTETTPAKLEMEWEVETFA